MNNRLVVLRSVLFVVCALALLPPAARAEEKLVPLPGIEIGSSPEALASGLEERCSEVRRVEAPKPTLPLARDHESYLICVGYEEAGERKIEEIAFTFADGSLVIVEARGGALAAIATRAGEITWKMIGLELYLDANAIIDPEGDAAWILSAEALHPHLYIWSNPHLPSFQGPVPSYDSSAARPDILEFGGKLEQLKQGLKAACPRADRDVEETPWLPTGPSSQLQINCYGFVYAGFPRKIEAVFGDERLDLAWILTGKGEEDRVRQALIAAFGEPIFVSDVVEAFDEWRVALRKDKPEVLMVIDELAPVFEKEFGGSVEQ
jgi:hypothetical protein